MSKKTRNTSAEETHSIGNGAVKNGIVTPDRAWIPRRLSKLSAETAEIPWVWDGYLARGFTTVFTGLWKSGKTTMACHLLKALDGQTKTFCGRPVTKAKVAVVSEEPERLWVQRRDELGIGDHVRVVIRPFLKRPSYKTWERFIASLAARVAEWSYTLVVLDSLPNLWPVQDENDASAVLSALVPLNALTEAGGAVLLLAHPAKNDAGEGRATRGSGALGGFVDVILEMRRYDPERPKDTRRVLVGYGRLPEVPSEMVAEYEAGQGYRTVGTKAEAQSDDRQCVFLPLLPKHGAGITVDELLEQWPKNDVPKPSNRTLIRDLESAIGGGLVSQGGKGVKGSRFRYRRLR